MEEENKNLKIVVKYLEERIENLLEDKKNLYKIIDAYEVFQNEIIEYNVGENRIRRIDNILNRFGFCRENFNEKFNKNF